MRAQLEAKRTTNSSVLNKLNREHLNCAHCPPNRGENASGKRRPRPDKHKDHRR
jgi:hypothetical protein